MAFIRKVINTLASTALVVTASMGVAEELDQAALIKAQMIEDLGGSDRINFSGKLRMLSQRIPAAACNLNAGIKSDLSAEILAATSAEFNKIVNALEYGDPSIGIKGAETRRKTLAALNDLRDQWVPVSAAVNLILDEGVADSLTEQLAEQNGPLLGAAKILVSELTGQYSDPAALMQADALRIDIAGRQRMLSQKISKELCFILSGIGADSALEALPKTIQTFEVSLTALREGMPAAGIQASTNPDIVAGLDVVLGHWVKLKPHFDTVIASRELDPETRAQVFEELNVLLVDMNKVVGMYAQVSKQQI